MSNGFALEHDERLIIAGFRQTNNAQKAREELETLGFTGVQVEELDLIPGGGDPDINRSTLAGDFPGLAQSVYDTEFGLDDAPLLSANPDASGLATASQIPGEDVILAVIIKEEQAENVEKILRGYGATF